MLRDQIGPAMRLEGFVGAGSEWTLPDPDYLAMLGIQRSKFSNADLVRFTVNLRVTSRADWITARSTSPLLPVWPKVNVHYSVEPGWTARIGKLMDEPRDHWWVLRVDEEPEPVASDVMAAIRSLAMPAIRDRMINAS